MLNRRSILGGLATTPLLLTRRAKAWRRGKALRTLVAVGDSITAFGGLGSYADLYAPLANPTLDTYTNAGVSGYHISDLVTAFPTLPVAGTPRILSVLIGANDLESYPGGNTAWLAALASYTNNARSTGQFKVVVCTVLPKGPLADAGFNALQSAVNAQILGSWGVSNADFICDFTSNPNLTDATNTTYFSADQVHPTNAGFSTMETTYAPVINAIR